jgi:hypothetical protein
MMLHHTIPIAVLVICGLRASMYHPSKLLYPFQLWVKEHTSIYFHKPLFTCGVCMGSVWGSAVYWMYWWATGYTLMPAELWLGWPVSVLGSAFLSGLSFAVFEAVEKADAYYTVAAETHRKMNR